MANIYPSQSCNFDIESLMSDETSPITVAQLGKVLLQSWTNDQSNPLYTRINLPPLINKSNTREIMTIFKKWKGFLTCLSDTGNIMGSLFFTAGSIMGYGLYYGFASHECGFISCQTFQSIMALIGGMLFPVAPTATFVLANAISCEDRQLTLNSVTYIIGGFFYILGGLCYFPYPSSTGAAESYDIALTVGASLYVIGSIFFVLAVVWDICRARNLKVKSQITFMTFIVEFWVSGLYLLGSYLLLSGSILSYPTLFTPHIYGIFLFASFCFTFGSVYGFTTQLWRFSRKVLREQTMVKSKNAFTKVIQRHSLEINANFITISRSTSRLIPLPKSYVSQSNLPLIIKVKSNPILIQVKGKLSWIDESGTELSQNST